MGNNTQHQISMELNVSSSKLLQALSTGELGSFEAYKAPFNAVDNILDEIVSKLGTVNRVDLPLYIAALEMLTTSLKTNLTDVEDKLLDTLLEHSDVTTIHLYADVGGEESDHN